MKMEQTECSETSAYTIQTPGNYPEENTPHYETQPTIEHWTTNTSAHPERLVGEEGVWP